MVLTKTHLNPGGAFPGSVGVASWVDFAQFLTLFSSCLVDAKTSMAARIKPIAASAMIPQKINVGTCINSVPFSLVDYSAQRGGAAGGASEARDSNTTREAHPVGNTGITFQQPTVLHAAALPLNSGVLNHG
jgi:hypothetical protein